MSKSTGRLLDTPAEVKLTVFFIIDFTYDGKTNLDQHLLEICSSLYWKFFFFKHTAVKRLVCELPYVSIFSAQIKSSQCN